MSNRTLIEINHDFAAYLNNPEFVIRLRQYLSSASKEAAAALSPFGVKVLGMRHHSDQFYIEGEPDGFPVKTFPARKP